MGRGRRGGVSSRGSGAESDEPVEMTDAFLDRSASECLRSWPGEGACSTLSIVKSWREEERTVQPVQKPTRAQTLDSNCVANKSSVILLFHPSCLPTYHHHPPLYFHNYFVHPVYHHNAPVFAFPTRSPGHSRHRPTNASVREIMIIVQDPKGIRRT